MGRYELVSPLSLFHELDRSFGSFFNDNQRAVSHKLNPITNVREESEFFELSMDVPGIKKEDIKVELKENILTITGERKTKYKDENGQFESMGSFERSFTLPKNVDPELIEVTHNHGVLDILLPKAQPKDVSKVLEIKTDQNTISN